MDGIPAIYEDGVFKPVGPVSLPERTEVLIPLPEDSPAESSETRRSQKAALDGLLEAVRQLPAQPNPDGFSGKDHDDVLYGGPDGPA